MAGALSTFRYLRTYNASPSLQTQLSGGDVTATFNSEYIRTGWYDYVGLLVKVGTVTGTTPTLDIKAQVSHDGGTTWHDVYPTDADKESTSADTTNQAIMTQFDTTDNVSKMKIWPMWFHAGSGGEIDGSDTRLDPRLRFVFTITGTSPVFPLTAIFVARKYAGR
jgi:hypothetical protein